MMPNPWELSPFQLKSTLTDAAGARPVPPARLTHVMLRPGRSSWQARVHNKFEGFAHGRDGVLRLSCFWLRSSRLPPSQRTGRRIAAWSSPATLTIWREIEQDRCGAILCNSIGASTLVARLRLIRRPRGKFRSLQSRSRVTSCKTRQISCKQLIAVICARGAFALKADPEGVNDGDRARFSAVRLPMFFASARRRL